MKIGTLKALLSPQVKDNKLEDFKDIYNEYHLFVRKSVYYIVGNKAIDDIVQDTFLKAWKSFNKFQHRSTLKTWLYRIAMNTAYDYLKKEKKTVEIEDIKMIDHEGQRISKDLLQYLLSRLSHNQLEVFLLHYSMGHTTSEIAEILNIPEGTAKTRLFKARNIFLIVYNNLEGSDE